MVRVSRRVFQRLLPERPTPERCLEAYYLQRTRFENGALFWGGPRAEGDDTDAELIPAANVGQCI